MRRKPRLQESDDCDEEDAAELARLTHALSSLANENSRLRKALDVKIMEREQRAVDEEMQRQYEREQEEQRLREVRRGEEQRLREAEESSPEVPMHSHSLPHHREEYDFHVPNSVVVDPVALREREASWSISNRSSSGSTSRSISASTSTCTVATLAEPPLSSKGPASRRSVPSEEDSVEDVFASKRKARRPLGECVPNAPGAGYVGGAGGGGGGGVKSVIPAIAITAATPPMKRVIGAETDSFYTLVTEMEAMTPETTYHQSYVLGMW